MLPRDTAGQERYASLAPLYYRGASAAIVVYDVTSKDTFAKAQHWIQELHKNASGSLGELCRLIGTAANEDLGATEFSFPRNPSCSASTSVRHTTVVGVWKANVLCSVHLGAAGKQIQG